MTPAEWRVERTREDPLALRHRPGVRDVDPRAGAASADVAGADPGAALRLRG
jgi:hypothetical protein